MSKKKQPKPRIGRPPTGETPQHSIRVPAADWARWQAAADKEDATLTAWIVDACEKKLNMGKSHIRPS